MDTTIDAEYDPSARIANRLSGYVDAVSVIEAVPPTPHTDAGCEKVGTSVNVRSTAVATTATIAAARRTGAAPGGDFGRLLPLL